MIWPIVTTLTIMLLGCGAPAVLLVDGVKVEPPSDQSRDPEKITLSYPVSQALDSLKLDLVRFGFTIKESDQRLGIIQTDDKLLAKDENFEHAYSSEQKADGCLLAFLFVGCLAGAAAMNSHNNGNTPPTHPQNDTYISETQPTVDQTKGRLQIIVSKGSDSTNANIEITAYVSNYTNGIKVSEEQTIRLHPFVQKYACLLAHKNCGKAPGQKSVPEKPDIP
jgi:hypothetical protein